MQCFCSNCGSTHAQGTAQVHACTNCATATVAGVQLPVAPIAAALLAVLVLKKVSGLRWQRQARTA